ncbi:MAG TPA: tetratricopeptide repeat protein, partial [Gammaproteobacteria bacterium]|nr:tetratricopeptide repeat protein [Gammaproteobacteria bacterium]
MLRRNMVRREVNGENAARHVLSALSMIMLLGLPVMGEAKSVDDAKQLIRVKDFQGATVVLNELAIKGDSEAQYMLAVMVRNGHGVDRDLSQAFKWFFKAAQNKHIKAQYEVGMCYKNGLGVQKDMAQA